MMKLIHKILHGIGILIMPVLLLAMAYLIATTYYRVLKDGSCGDGTVGGRLTIYGDGVQLWQSGFVTNNTPKDK